MHVHRQYWPRVILCCYSNDDSGDDIALEFISRQQRHWFDEMMLSMVDGATTSQNSKIMFYYYQNKYHSMLFPVATILILWVQEHHILALTLVRSKWDLYKSNPKVLRKCMLIHTSLDIL